MDSEAAISGQNPGEDAPAHFQTGKVLTLSACHFIHDIYSSFLSPLLPLLIEKLSMSLTQAGFTSTVLQLPSLLNPLLGTLADRISVRYFIILAPMITAVSMSLIATVPSYAVLLILLAIAGVSVSIFHVPAPVMVARLSGVRKGRGMSFFMTGGELARAVGPLAAVGAVALVGLQRFYLVMLVGVFASLWLFLRFREVPIRTTGAAPTSVSSVWREMQHIMVPLAGILVFRGFMHAALATFLPTFIKLDTGNLWLAGIALAVYETAGVFGVMASGSISDRLGRRRILLISLLGAPISLLLFWATGGWVRFAALVMVGFTLLSTTPVMLALVQEHARSSPSAANGFFMMISFIARSAVVVLVGFVADHIGLRTTYLISALLGLLAIPVVLRLPPD
jgi:FSR family fosmidomycin resistance protein-like MFS transporter